MSAEQPSELPSEVHCVLDGGALLHRVPIWTKGQSYQEIIDKYIAYVKTHYGRSVTVVFDGYHSPCTKDSTHIRRQVWKMGFPVQFSPTMLVVTNKDTFLSNPQNKAAFITELSNQLFAAGYNVQIANGDADVPIVLAAVASAEETQTVDIGDDTNLLILLIFHCDSDSCDLYFAPEPKINSKQRQTESRKIWDLNKVKSILCNTCQHILFVHAFLGCDSTSRLFGVGKSAALKMIVNKNKTFVKAAQVFHDINSSKSDIISSREKAVALFYTKKVMPIDDLRYEIFSKKVACGSKAVESKNLPPTSSALAFHSLRVFYQVHEWIGQHNLNPLEYGWKQEGTQCLPVMTSLPAAPDALLKVIKCNCKSGCKTSICSCKKYGLECTGVCGECKGLTSENAQQMDMSIDLDIWY